MVDKSIRDRLAQWDTSLAPLADNQKEDVMILSSVAGQRPFPSHLTSRDHPHPVPSVDAELSNITEKMQSIKTTHDLLSWFDEMDHAASTNEDKLYRDYCDCLREYNEQCGDTVGRLNDVIEGLIDMKEKHEFVSEKTQKLHDACEILVQEQTQLSNVAKDITDKLSYFTELEQLGQKLNAPSFSALSDNFPVLLSRLDECIAFIEEHSHYKESYTYLARYKQQLSKALATIRHQVTGTLKSITSSVLQQQHSTPSQAPDTSYSLFYGKFRGSAPKIKTLMHEVEQRKDKSNEYNTLLHDCLSCYTQQRQTLLSPSIISTLTDITKQHQLEYSTVVRSVCNLLCRVCLDEHQLYHHFFTLPSTELNTLLEDFSYLMYDTLRPIVIHIKHLETLTDLCTILKVEVIEEVVEPKGDQLTVYGNVIKGLLSDIQQRLVFRAQRYIQTDIRGYKPSGGDLAYPDKLIIVAEAQTTTHGNETYSDVESVFDTSGTESEATTPSLSSTPDVSSTFVFVRSGGHKRRGHDLNEFHAMWYPTVRRSLMCLSKLYRCLEKIVFEGLAQEIISECVISLQTAADAIFSKKGSVHSELFLIKHLLILREQISAFNVNFSIKEVHLDFTKTKTAAYNLFKKRSRFFSLGTNNAFLEFLFEGFPELIEMQLDSKKEVDLKLKSSCETFIKHSTSSLSLPLKTLVGKYNVIIELAGKEDKDTASFIIQQPFADPKDVHSVINQTNKLIKTQVPLLKHNLSLYLSNEETEHILFKPIKANILSLYQSMEDICGKYYSKEDQQIITCPTQYEVTLMLSLPAAKDNSSSS